MATVGKPITCKAAVIHEFHKPYVIENVEVAPPKGREVRIKMTSTGLCHSDLHFQEGCDAKLVLPAILGHEGAGIVESVGSGVKTVAPGDAVVLVFESYCGECDLCKSPKTNKCRVQSRVNLFWDGTSRMTLKGKQLSILGGLGTFSEYIVAEEIKVTKVNPKAPMDKLCLAGCCIPTGYGAAMECAKVEPGATCATWGLGGVGLNVVLGCRDSKASKIIGIDLNPKKFALAKEFGCTDVINPRDHSKSVPDLVKELSGGDGVDYCFVSVGVKAAMDQALKSSNEFWGTTILIGLTDVGDKIGVDVWDTLYGRKLRGTYYGSYKARLAIPHLVEKVIKGEIPIEKLVSHVVPLEKINEGYDKLRSGEAIRAIVDFDVKK